MPFPFGMLTEWLSRVRVVGIDEHAKCQAHLVCEDFGDDGVEGVKDIFITCLKNWNFLGNSLRSLYLAA